MKSDTFLLAALLSLTMLWLGCGASRNAQEEEVQALLSSSAGYLNQKGTAALDSGRYDEAERCFREAASLTGHDPALFNNLGVALYHLGQLDSAIAAYATAIRLRPHYTTAYRNMATAYHAKKNFPLALKAAERALQTDPRDAENFSLQALMLQELDQFEPATLALQRALALAPQHAPYYNNLGTLYFRQGRIDKAIGQFQEAIRLQPAVAEFYFNLANALTRQCRLEESLPHYDKALTIDPHMIGAANNKGLVLMALQQYDAAISAFRQALTANAREDIVLYNLSVAMMRKDSAAAALTYIDRAIAVQRDLATYHQQKGAVLNALGRNPEALLSFQKAVALDSSLAAGYNNLGTALIAQQNAGEAVTAFEKAAELFPEYMDARYFGRLKVQDQHYVDLLSGCADAWEMKADYAMIYNNLGKALLAMGRSDQAESAFKKSISIQADLPESYEQLAMLYHEQKKSRMAARMAAQGRLQRAWFALRADSLEAAGRYARQAMLIDPDNADACAVLAFVHMRKLEWAEAEKRLRQGVSLKKPSSRLQLAYGQYWLYRQDREKALASLHQALALAPGDPEGFRVMYQTLNGWGKTEEANAYLAELHYLNGQQLEFAGQWDRALLEYRQAAGVRPDDSRFGAAQGLLFLKKHLNAEAEEILTGTIRQDSTQSIAWYGLGVLQGDRGQHENAIASLQRAIAQKPEFGQAHYSLAVNYFFTRQYKSARRHLEQARACGAEIKTAFEQALREEEGKE